MKTQDKARTIKLQQILSIYLDKCLKKTSTKIINDTSDDFSFDQLSFIRDGKTIMRVVVQQRSYLLFKDGGIIFKSEMVVPLAGTIRKTLGCDAQVSFDELMEIVNLLDEYRKIKNHD